MIFSIFKPKEINKAMEFKVQSNYLKKNRLWNVNEGTLLLHMYTDSPDLLREIGFTSLLERTNLMKFTPEQMRTIFIHFVQRGRLRSVDFESDYDDYDMNSEVELFNNKIGFRKEKLNHEIKNLMDHYDYLVNEVTGPPKSFHLEIDNDFVRFYNNSVISATSVKTDTKSCLDLYEEIFGILNMELTLKELLLIEKDKELHPMNQSYKLLNELFCQAGDETKEKVGVTDIEYEYIKKQLLDYTSSFENQLIYTNKKTV